MIARNVCSWGRVAHQGAFSLMRLFTRVCARVTRDIRKTRHNAPRAPTGLTECQAQAFKEPTGRNDEP